MSKAQVGEGAGRLVELANRTAAVGSISLASPPKKNLPGKDPKDWKKWSEEMVKAAKEFEKAAKGGDAKTIKEAAVKLNSSCVDCHGTFRDSVREVKPTRAACRFAFAVSGMHLIPDTANAKRQAAWFFPPKKIPQKATDSLSKCAYPQFRHYVYTEFCTWPVRHKT